MGEPSRRHQTHSQPMRTAWRLHPLSHVCRPRQSRTLARGGRLARFLDSSTYMQATDGKACGTLRYMAPEQCQTTRVTLYVDVYAFGVMLNEAEVRADAHACAHWPFTVHVVLNDAGRGVQEGRAHPHASAARPAH
eukprot:7376782-Prymnesium_polylepis.1